MKRLPAALALAGFLLAATPALAQTPAAAPAARGFAVPAQLSASERENYTAIFADLRAQNWAGAAGRLDGMRSGPLHELARAMLYDPRWPWHAAAKLGAQVRAPKQYWRSQPREFKNLFDGASFGQR
jgi:hypothetical protein